MSISVPNNTRFCVNFTFSGVSHFSFNIVSSEVQKRLIKAHFQNICSMLSFSSLQKPHWVLAVTPILFNTLLVAIILCIMCICNHLSFTSLILGGGYFYENCIPRNIWLQFFTLFQATIWHTVVVYENVVIERCTLWCRVDVLSEIFTSSALLLLISIVDFLIYCFIELVQLLKVNRHAKLCIKFCKSAKLPIFFYKMNDTVHSIVNPLCVFDHLVSDDHILVIENRFRKKLRCRVWFHFTTENSISFEDVWPEGIIFDSLVEKAGAVALQLMKKWIQLHRNISPFMIWYL